MQHNSLSVSRRALEIVNLRCGHQSFGSSLSRENISHTHQHTHTNTHEQTHTHTHQHTHAHTTVIWVVWAGRPESVGPNSVIAGRGAESEPSSASATPMDVDAVGKGKGTGCFVCGRPGHAAKDCKFNQAKCKAQGKGKAKSAPPDKNSPAKFEGECRQRRRLQPWRRWKTQR